MALDEATKRVYRRTDSATLLGLLPELRRLGKATHKERERVLADSPNGLPVDHGDGYSDGVTADCKYAADLAAYAAATLERDTWIRNELKRRDLLPLWPGEREHLLDDS